jgi:membrane protein
MRKLFNLLKLTYQEWKEDRASRLAAALAYYTIFSLAPMLVIAIAVAGLLWQRDAVTAQVMRQIQGLVGVEGATFVADLLESASNPAEGIVATIVGIITLLFGALGVFNELHNSLNVIWEVQPEKQDTFWESVKKAIIDRFLSFTMVLGIGFLLLVSLVVSAGLSATQEVLGNAFPIPEFLLQLLNLVISIGVITVLFAMIYKYLPDTEVPWRYVWLGAFATAILFSLGKMLIGIYLGNSAVASSFGAAGSLVLLLVWIYYSAQILFFGAEFTQVYANMQSQQKVLPQDQRMAAPKNAEDKPVTATQAGTPAVSSPFFPVEPITAAVEEENKQTARFFLGFMLASFFSGIMATIFGLKKR